MNQLIKYSKLLSGEIQLILMGYMSSVFLCDVHTLSSPSNSRDEIQMSTCFSYPLPSKLQALMTSNSWFQPKAHLSSLLIASIDFSIFSILQNLDRTSYALYPGLSNLPLLFLFLAYLSSPRQSAPYLSTI